MARLGFRFICVYYDALFTYIHIPLPFGMVFVMCSSVYGSECSPVFTVLNIPCIRVFTLEHLSCHHGSRFN